jgi:predicted AlkP superfamily pyrophosphatase or phosphodiesterase
MRPNLLRLLAVLLLPFCAVTTLRAESPKLVLAIIVDQMRYDYLEQSPHLFAPNGFRLLLERGAFMTSAKYNYYPTVTAPGHASFLSGCGPAIHGILGNDWFNKFTGKDMNACLDTNVTAVGTTNKSQASPKNFIGANLADQMRFAFNSKVIGVSIKDRAAIFPAGKKPAAAYWFDNKSGNFITSTYYMTNLPQWVTDFNDKKIPQSYIGKTWDRLYDPSEYMFADQGFGEGHLNHQTNDTTLFPHTILASTNLENVLETPFGDELLTQFAIATLDNEQLGQTNHPDLLTLSYSSPDLGGHVFGPNSHEHQDIIFRLDRQLDKLFNHIDEKIGLKNVIIVLTADHAVAPTPEFAQSMGLDSKRFKTEEFMTNLQTHLEGKFGAGKFFRTMKMPYGDIFLNHETLREKSIPIAAINSAIRDYALNSGYIQTCYTRDQLLDGNAPGWIGQCVLNGYNPERGADLVLVAKPFVIPGKEKTGTTHGSPYAYDTRVPVLFFGQPFKPGRYPDEFYITDIAATLSSALHIEEPPGSIGKVALRIMSDQ